MYEGMPRYINSYKVQLVASVNSYSNVYSVYTCKYINIIKTSCLFFNIFSRLYALTHSLKYIVYLYTYIVFVPYCCGCRRSFRHFFLFVITTGCFGSCSSYRVMCHLILKFTEWLTVTGKSIRLQWRFCRSWQKKLRGTAVAISLLIGIPWRSIFESRKS